MKLEIKNMRLILLVIFLLIYSVDNSFAKSPAQTIGNAATKRIVKKLSPFHIEKFGQLHTFRRNTKLVRVTNKPSIEKKFGVTGDSFWIRSKQGRNPSADYARKKLDIPHDVKAKVTTIAQKGSLYHERPLRNGKAHTREVIIEAPIRAKDVSIAGYLER